MAAIGDAIKASVLQELETERLAERLADALIEIGADFTHLCPVEDGPHVKGCPGATICNHCGEDIDNDCGARCAGAASRRALGVG